ncbi:phage tail protein [Brevibacillus brevis]|uniref:phage tail protein n=1 Tax=Brevibacillus brevis TaxID=1393 RepID=UPI000D0EF284|nr:tail fiber protein [Brevibacillus brevis]PSJ70072.1 phage tail protein [Brevibacillus brevis]RED29939.1 microcystin-dependent protein [Brevibacillus brevis]GEC88325.1 microcystin dependent MdpB family protein [Brevibacillus brevis]VEF88487.1 Phage Tail Collar Domain [Brevibacillus brevis]
MAEPFLGEIRMFGGDYAPQGWALCNGQILSISEYDTLFSLIGTTYGGDGQTTFALPDLRGRIPLHQGKNPSTGTTYVMGEKNGVESVTLTVSQLPAHTHTVHASSQPGTQNSPANAVWAKNAQQYSANAPDGVMNASSLSAVGGNQPHSNLMPYTVINFIIALYGIYPQQN